MNKRIYLILTVIFGSFLLWPSLNFQPMLAQGDHGRDLYCFKKTLDGAIAYRDFWWVYGPLMPYYYGLFYKLCGISIQSVLLGKILLQLTAGILFYLTMACFASSFLSFIGAIWFFTFNSDFSFTYNHIGATVLCINLIYILFLYIKYPRTRYIYLGIFASFVLSLIKANIGVFNFIGFILSLLLIDFSNKKISKERMFFYIKITLGFLSTVFFIYWIFVHGLPVYVIRQCIIVLRADHPYYSPWSDSVKMLWAMMLEGWTATWPSFLLGALIQVSFAQIIFSIWKKRIEEKDRNKIFLIIIILTLFAVLNLHEFIDSGVAYRSFWISPFKFLLMFLIIFYGTGQFIFIIRFLLGSALILILLLSNINIYSFIQSHKTPANYLPFDKAKIYVANSPQWIATVKDTVYFLDKTLKKDETFFALPYDPLYYFFTGKDSPTRQLIFFDHINIRKEQEEEIITQLETKKVNFILLSSRIKTTEPRLGTFGQTYCPVLAQYIEKNFVTIATFGDWKNDPGWAWNHGTKIFKRNKPL